MRQAGVSFLLLMLVAAYAEADHAQFFAVLQNAIQAKDEAAYLHLVQNDPDIQKSEKEFIEGLMSFNYQRAIFQLADDRPSQLLVQVFLEAPEQARVEAWTFTTILVDGQDVIHTRRTVSSLTGLYRLRMDTEPIHIRNLDIKHFDATFHLKDGDLFLIKAAGAITGVVFVGNATFEFSPADSTEKQQLTLFCKQPRLVTSVPAFYLRASTENLKNLFGKVFDSPTNGASQLLSRAKEIEEAGNLEAYNVVIPLTNEVWFPMVEQDNFLCQMKSSYGTLLYQYSPSEKDNAVLMRKEKEQVISLYNVNGTRGADPPDEFKIIDYKLQLSYQPHSTYFNGLAQMQVESNLPISSIVLKLSPQLRVTSIRSSQGPLIYFQENQTKTIRLIFNQPLDPGDRMDVSIKYQGSLEAEEAKTEAQSARSAAVTNEQHEIYVPPSYLYSNQTLWYPQPSFKTYMHGTIIIIIPSGFTAVSNGQLTSRQQQQGQQTFVFDTTAPVKYFSLFVGRLGGLLSYSSIVPIQVYYDVLDKKTALDYALSADKILRFFSDYFGPYPYKTLTLVLRPLKEPGGHAPATVAIVNRVYTFWQLRFRKDPLYQPEFPMLLLAHEIAHQWWGQCIGWRDYQDQWLSEGFAQFAAWEYVRHVSGDRDWSRLADIFSDWIEDKTYSGPLILGARLGHLTEDPRAFSAILYNKGAYILNMLKNWIGPEAFRASLHDFRKTFEFRFANMHDFEETVQKHSPQSLSGFFRQWLYTWAVPSVSWTNSTERKDSQLYLKLRFTQPENSFYLLRVPVVARSKDGNTFQAVVNLEKPQQEVELQLPFQPDSILIDPLHENLMKAEKQ